MLGFQHCSYSSAVMPPFPLPQVSIMHFSKFFIDDNILQSVKEMKPAMKEKLVEIGDYWHNLERCGLTKMDI